MHSFEEFRYADNLHESEMDVQFVDILEAPDLEHLYPLENLSRRLRDGRNKKTGEPEEYGWTELVMRDYLEDMEFAIALRVHEVLTSRSGKSISAGRTVGAMWGTNLDLSPDVIAAGSYFRNVLEILMICTDPAYTRFAEEQMFRNLKEQMHARRWRHLAVRTPLEPTPNDLTFLRRNDFALRDVRDGQLIWQWPQDDNGVEIAPPKKRRGRASEDR